MVLTSLLAATREYLRLMRHKKHILLRLQNTELDVFQVKGPVQMFPHDSMIYVGHVVTVYYVVIS